MRYETLIKYHSTKQLREVLDELGHEGHKSIATNLGFNAYIIALAVGDYGDEGMATYRALASEVMIQFH